MPAFQSRCDQATIDLIASRMRQDEDGAMALIGESLAAAPQDARLYLLRGAIHAQRGHADAARADFSQAVVLDPAQHAARYMLGHLELVEGQAERAVAIWAPLLPLRHEAVGCFASGMTALVAGSAPDALAELRRGLELSPPGDALASFFHATVAAIERSASEQPLPAASALDEEDGGHYLLAEYLSTRTQH
jgi:tetratricopeptide (TPR) repeat protein